MNRTLISILLAGLVGLYCGSASAGSYTDGTGTAVGTVTDNTTGLMWQKQDNAAKLTWKNAKSYCKDLSLGGFTDWRLPNVKELRSLFDRSRHDPSIDPLFTTDISNYWSSTMGTGDDMVTLPPGWTEREKKSYAVVVEFHRGHRIDMDKTHEYYVRCVRGKGNLYGYVY